MPLFLSALWFLDNIVQALRLIFFFRFFFLSILYASPSTCGWLSLTGTKIYWPKFFSWSPSSNSLPPSPPLFHHILSYLHSLILLRQELKKSWLNNKKNTMLFITSLLVHNCIMEIYTLFPNYVKIPVSAFASQGQYLSVQARNDYLKINYFFSFAVATIITMRDTKFHLKH